MYKTLNPPMQLNKYTHIYVLSVTEYLPCRPAQYLVNYYKL